MRKPIQISIPTPCHEKWAEMTPADKGRFCNSCRKTVIDFTRASDREIAQALHNDKHLCGRFISTQLNRDLVVPKEKSSLWAAASAAVLTFLTIGSNEATAQTVKTEQTDIKLDSIDSIPDTEVLVIKGTISDYSGPLPGASISVKGSTASTQSDMEGNYSIEAKKGDVLEFSFVDYHTREIVIDTDSKICILMIEDENAAELTYDIYGRPKRLTFFDRIFLSIGNWFK